MTLDLQELRARRLNLLGEVEQLRSKGGGTLAGLHDPLDIEHAKTLNGELNAVAGEIKGAERPGLRQMVHPGASGGGSGVVRPSKGWKAGHWSQPFMRQQKDLTPSGSVTVPSLSGGVVPIEDRPTRLLDVIPSTILVNTDQFAYLRETARTHAAAETAPGALKPTSTYTVEKVEDSVRVIAHLSEPVNRYDLEDAAMLAAYVDGSLRAGVQVRLDGQILNGDGLGQNLAGVVGVATPLVPFATDILTTARKALTALQDNEIEGGVFVLSTAMWEALELTTAGTDGAYYLGGPVNAAAKRLWGQRVISTSALTGDTAFLVDFAGSTHLWERNTVRVDWSEAPVGSVAAQAAFNTNELVFRAEGRWGFAVLRDAGVIPFDTTAA